MNSIRRKSALSLAALMVTGGAIAGTQVPQAAEVVSAPAIQASTEPLVMGEPQGTDGRVLEYRYQAQPNSYYCAPAATRIALSTQGKILSQKDVAERLGTTKAGTNSANDTTRVLNEVTAAGYETTIISGPEANPQQVDKLRADTVEAINAKRGVVANTIGTAVDTNGKRHSFPGGHYVSIVGYRDSGGALQVVDPYGPKKQYWMNTEKVADWIAERGYSS